MTSHSVLVCVCFCVLLVLLLLLLLVVCIVRLTISAAKISSLQNRTRTRTSTTTRQLFSRSHRLRQENCDDHQNLRSNDQTIPWSKLRYEERASSRYPAARKRDFVLVMRFPNPLSNVFTMQHAGELFDHQKDRREEKEESATFCSSVSLSTRRF